VEYGTGCTPFIFRGYTRCTHVLSLGAAADSTAIAGELVWYSPIGSFHPIRTYPEEDVIDVPTVVSNFPPVDLIPEDQSAIRVGLYQGGAECRCLGRLADVPHGK